MGLELLGNGVYNFKPKKGTEEKIPLFGWNVSFWWSDAFSF